MLTDRRVPLIPYTESSAVRPSRWRDNPGDRGLKPRELQPSRLLQNLRTAPESAQLRFGNEPARVAKFCQRREQPWKIQYAATGFDETERCAGPGHVPNVQILDTVRELLEEVDDIPAGVRDPAQVGAKGKVFRPAPIDDRPQDTGVGGQLAAFETGAVVR